MKANRFLLAAGILLAMAFTFSCSNSDDDGGGGGNNSFPDLPTQVYLDGKEYTGSGDIWIKANRISENISPAGKIQNGKIMLNLPENIGNEYMGILSGKCDDYEYSFFCDVSYTPNLRINKKDIAFRTIISGKECWLGLMAVNESAWFFYALESGEMKGIVKYDLSEIKAAIDYGAAVGGDLIHTSIFDIDISKGWNVVYVSRECEYYNGQQEECEESQSTDSKIIKGELKWQAFCGDD